MSLGYPVYDRASVCYLIALAHLTLATHGESASTPDAWAAISAPFAACTVTKNSTCVASLVVAKLTMVIYTPRIVGATWYGGLKFCPTCIFSISWSQAHGSYHCGWRFTVAFYQGILHHLLDSWTSEKQTGYVHHLSGKGLATLCRHSCASFDLHLSTKPCG
jgi:hypothetical protein